MEQEDQAPSFGGWLKERRKELDLTQIELGERVGCSEDTIQKIESGERRPSKQIAQRLAECLHIPPDEHETFILSAREPHSASSSPSRFSHATRRNESPVQANLTKLPTPLTPLIGRQDAVTQVRDYLLRDGVRLLTLTGPPGIGKTRLSLQVGQEVLVEFTDGVFLTELASISDPDLVAPTIAVTLGIKETANRPILDSVKQFLGAGVGKVMLILDNFEQVLDAAPVVVELLSSCPQLKVLVTSREALHVMGEQQFPVPPLEIPDLSQLPDTELLPGYPAVELFIQRASANDPNFALALTEDNLATVAAICARLQGLPLAIELAAARIKLLSPKEMFSRLDRQLKLLTSAARYGNRPEGASHLPLRHQTMRGAVDWSYQLLLPGEQKLLSRLGVFVGGWTLEAAEAVCATEAGLTSDVSDGIESLLEKSLLRRLARSNRSQRRFTMLEAVREYASERLQESGEQDMIKREHALYFLRLAEEADLKIWAPYDVIWLDRVDEEHDNMRAALLWSKSINGDVETELRLVVALARFWEIRGYLSEGRERMASVLSRPETREGDLRPLRAWALVQMGSLAFWQSDYPACHSAWDEALYIFKERGDKAGLARTLVDLGDVAREEGDHDTSALLCQQALDIYRELGDTDGTAVTLALLGWAHIRPGYFAQATAHLQEALALARQVKRPNRVALALSALGEVLVRQGFQDQAIPMLEESLMIRRQGGYRWGIAASIGTLGWATLRRGDYEQAAEMLSESITIRKELEDKGGTAWCLEKFAEIEIAEGRPARAACLLGAAEALRQTIGTAVDISDRADYERSVRDIRTELGEAVFVEAWEEGRTMTFERAIAYAVVARPGGSISRPGLTDSRKENSPSGMVS